MRNEAKLFMRKALALSVLLCAANVFAGDQDQIQEAAANGDARAQYRLGQSYFSGTRFPGDEQIGIGWLRRAANQGHAKAQLALGIQYEAGTFLQRDSAEAMKWFQLAADQGDSEAQFNLGIGFRAGRGVEKDAEKGLLWLKRAVDQSNSNAQMSIAMMYMMGDGVKKDTAQGIVWAKRSADQGNAFAQYTLGIVYLYGKVAKQDVGAGLALIRLSAAQGFPLSIVELEKYNAQQKAAANLRQMEQNAKKYYEAQPRPSAYFPASALPPPQTMPSLPPEAIPSRGNSSCPYGFCGGGATRGASSMGSQGGWVSAGLNGQDSAGGGYLRCSYMTSTGYQFTTSSRSSSCPSPVTVNPETGQVRN